MTKHQYYECPRPCEEPHCVYCDGGLSFCIVCKCAEGSLASECPGSAVSESAPAKTEPKPMRTSKLIQIRRKANELAARQEARVRQENVESHAVLEATCDPLERKWYTAIRVRPLPGETMEEALSAELAMVWESYLRLIEEHELGQVELGQYRDGNYDR
jgi:hypothetical protein